MPLNGSPAKRPDVDMLTPLAYSMCMKELTRDMFRKWGKAGGKKRSKQLSASKRSAIARKAARARWSKERGNDEGET